MQQVCMYVCTYVISVNSTSFLSCTLVKYNTSLSGYSLSLSLTHSCSLSHSLHSLSLTHSLHSLSLTHTCSLTITITHSLTHSLAITHSLTLTHSLTHTHTYTRMCAHANIYTCMHIRVGQYYVTKS